MVKAISKRPLPTKRTHFWKHPKQLVVWVGWLLLIGDVMLRTVLVMPVCNEVDHDGVKECFGWKVGTPRSITGIFDAANPLPQQTGPRILVVYGGPTQLLTEGDDGTSQKYHLNFEYFLKHGVDCATQDHLLVVTDPVYQQYQKRVDEMDSICQQENGHRIWMMTRQDKCLDLEAVRVALYESYQTLGGLNISTYYDYFFYINCGVAGPSKDALVSNGKKRPWTDIFLQKLQQPNVSMTGLSMHCIGLPHIQSMMYALDRTGLQTVMEAQTIFDCEKRFPDFYDVHKNVAHGKIVNAYERGMGTSLLKAGYGLDPLLRPKELPPGPVFRHNSSQCEANDIWIGKHLREFSLHTTGESRIPYLNETVFFKITRYLSPETAQEIGFQGKIKGNWE